MTTLTLRSTKGAPLTHAELDANFTALSSAASTGSFDSGVVVGSGGVSVSSGDVSVASGDLILSDGDIHYNPRITFYDLQNTAERMRIDSNGSLLVGSSVNSQTVNAKIARSGNQHTLFGSKTSNNGQTTRMELGPAGDGTETGAGLLATQANANFNDWSLDVFVANSNDGYINSISIDRLGAATINKEATFVDSVQMNSGLNVTGDILLNGTSLGALSSGAGTVSSVSFTGPTGFTLSGGPITTTGTITLGYSPSHSAGLPSNALQSDWSEAYGWGDHALVGYVKDSAGNGYAPSGRTISTTNGIQGGGDLTGNRTLSLDGTYTGDFDVTGNVRATQDVISFYTPSDERLKKDITVIENALDKVSSLRGVEFEYIESGIRSTGLIAQEVQKVLPDAVFIMDDDTGHMGVRYQITVGLLVEAIKELKAEIEELKK